MNGTPFKIRQLSSPYMQTDPGLSSDIDPNKEGESKKAFDYSGTTPTSEAIVNLVTPQNALELALEFIPGGVVGGRLTTKALKTKLGQKLIGKFPSLSKLTKPISTSTKTTKKAEFDYSGKAKQMEVDVGDVKWKKDLHVGKGPKVVDFKLNEMKSIGKNLDEMNFDATKLTQKDVKFKGIVSGRSIVEVKLPTGQTQLFYKSTDYSGKGVEDMWQAYGGHADVAGRKGWFIKDEGFKNFYDSKSFRDISGNLDRIAVEGDFQKHITKGQGYASKK